MSRKLVWLVVVVALLGASMAAVFGLKDSGPVQIQPTAWQRVTDAASISMVEPAYAQTLPGGEGQAPSAPTPGGSAEGAPADEGEAAAEAPAAEPKTPDDMLEKLKAWSEQDPRDLITKKFEDLDSKQTAPWDEESPETFIPNTGRNDPLTPLRDEIPEELRPPRSGEDDQNEIESYLFSAAATAGVDAMAMALQVYNVVQIGLNKLVTMGIAGQPAQTVQEGQSWGSAMNAGGFMVQVEASVASVSPEEVVIVITGSVPGTTVSISKTQYFIPGTPSNLMNDDGGGGGGGRGGGGRRGRGGRGGGGIGGG